MFPHIIKRDEYFFVGTKAGDAPGEAGAAHGLFFGDTRVLSRYVLSIEPGDVRVVSGSVRAGDTGRIVLLADELNSLEGPPRELVIERRPVIRGGFVERIELTNYGTEPCSVRLTLDLGADFKDMFEVRGLVREGRGQLQPPRTESNRIRFGYRGLDDMQYTTSVRFDPAPDSFTAVPGDGSSAASADAVRASFAVEVAPGAPTAVEVFVTAIVEPCADNGHPPLADEPAPPSHADALDAAVRDGRRWLAGCAEWRTDNEAVNDVLEQSLRDVRMLLNDFGDGPMPTAGVPWYAAPFGRDSLITAVQTLSVRPAIAAATLRTMARWQGSRHDPELDEAPGKIMHELRTGELARTKEIPFIPYYGTVDATPLFLIAAGEYWRWTGDIGLIRELMPALRGAADWIDREIEASAISSDGSGDYIAYHRRREGGLTNQGWKDSGDAVVHRDGTLAKPPITLAEVQGYVYAARLHFADLLEASADARSDGADTGASAGDHRTLAAEHRRRAARLKAAFNRDFWVEETGFYALALDGDKRPVASVSSNPGHGLWSGIVADGRAAAMAETLLSDGMFTGYGIRTLSAEERAYHPLSYHRGTVWPHDNSLIAMGFARYDHGTAAARIAAGLFATAAFDEYRRLPELFGGYAAGVDGPVSYPVACIPQAWAAAAPFLLLQAVLGLEPDIPNDRLAMSPRLPAGMNRVELSNVVLGLRRLRIVVERRPGRSDPGDCDWHVDVLEGEPLTVVSKNR